MACMNRREFIGTLGTTAALAALPAFARKPEELRTMLFHWGLNMWGESLPDGVKALSKGRRCNDRVKFSDTLWNELVDRMVAKKLNAVLIDLGEFPIYPSHPELALPGSRPAEWVQAEVRRLKSLGIEAIPKLNFSAGHDAWLGEYSRMLTTRKYYEVCHDVIRDTWEMFDHPRFLHIGYDEERPRFQHGYICVRENELWWHDLLKLVKECEALQMRPWMWSDYGWYKEHADFLTKCPKCIIHSNFYYDDWIQGFDLKTLEKLQDENGLPYKCLKFFIELDEAGFDQIPCSSNSLSRERRQAKIKNEESMGKLVKFCREHISDERTLGFLMAPWENCCDPGYGRTLNLEGIDQLAAAYGA